MSSEADDVNEEVLEADGSCQEAFQEPGGQTSCGSGVQVKTELPGLTDQVEGRLMEVKAETPDNDKVSDLDNPHFVSVKREDSEDGNSLNSDDEDPLVPDPFQQMEEVLNYDSAEGPVRLYDVLITPTEETAIPKSATHLPTSAAQQSPLPMSASQTSALATSVTQETVLPTTSGTSVPLISGGSSATSLAIVGNKKKRSKKSIMEKDLEAELKLVEEEFEIKKRILESERKLAELRHERVIMQLEHEEKMLKLRGEYLEKKLEYEISYEKTASEKKSQFQ